MADVLGLALPFFGLIFLGYACGRIARIDEHGLAWLNFFILYIALPALFFYLVSRTPFEQIANWSFVLATRVDGKGSMSIGIGSKRRYRLPGSAHGASTSAGPGRRVKISRAARSWSRAWACRMRRR